MKKLLLIFALINPAVHAMYMEDDNNNSNLRLRLTLAEQEIKQLKGTVENQKDAFIATQTVLTTLTCVCMGCCVNYLNAKMNIIAHKCK